MMEDFQVKLKNSLFVSNQLYLGKSLSYNLFKKNTMRRFLKMLFYGTLILIGVGVYFAKKNKKDEVKGNGTVTIEQRDVLPFNGVRISGGFEVVLNQGETYTVSIETDENLLENVTTEVHDGILEIQTTGHIGDFSKMKVVITSNEYNMVNTSGGVSLSSGTQLSGKSLEVKASGASKVNLDLLMESVHTDFSGAGDVTLSGEAGITTVDISGAGKLKAFDLKTHEMSISISGAGYAEVNTDQKLDVNVSGAGKVRYKGNPTEIKENISGAGVIDAEE